MRVIISTILIIASILCSCSSKKEKEKIMIENEFGFDKVIASNLAELALRCIQREYPNKPGHVINDKDDIRGPKQLHPAFYGCFDWHSSVHGHWMLVKLLKMFPDIENSKTIRKRIGENITRKNILKEVEYFNQKNRKSFERTYGWAWLLKLAEELYEWNDNDGKKWYNNLRPLTKKIVERYYDFLPKQDYPIRTGVHPNTAFGIGFALDYARKVGDKKFENFLIERTLKYFKNDRDYPYKLEPGGEDFLSPSLIEADLMRRVLERKKFERWLEDFIPDLKNEKAENLLKPVFVKDRKDPKIVHLDGLNLSRAWCMFGIANQLDKNNPLRNIMIRSGIVHAKAGLANILSGNYEGEHWLASFGIYMLSKFIEIQK